jgi:DNA repair exonuclease SbcCD ATPase subunit
MLERFMRYRDRCALDFSGKRTIAVVGANESGKSSLLRAISYGLYGEVPTPQGAVREVQLIHDGGKGGLLVELGVQFPDGSVLEITRGRTKRNEPVLRCSGVRGKPTDVQRYIAERVGLSYEDFVALSYFVQGDIHQFMSGNKRRYFQRWTEGLRRWARWEDAASSHARIVERSLSSVDRDTEAAKLLADSADDARRELTVARAAELKAKREAESVADRVKVLESNLAQHAVNEQVAQTVDALRQQLQQALTQQGHAGQQMRQLKSELRKVTSGVCPMLSLECPELKEAGDGQRAKLNRRNAAARASHDEAASAVESVGAQLQSAESQFSKVRKPVAELKRSLQEARRLLNLANRTLYAATQRLGRAEGNVELSERAAKTVSELAARRTGIETDLRRWQFVRYMCGRSGIPAELIEAELERVEGHCNWVLERLDYPKRIRFSGFKELAGYEKVCGVCGGERWRSGKCSGCGTPRPHKRKDEPTVTVLDGTHERPFALESGGAQTLQSFAVRLASSLFVASMTGVPVRLIMLDEVFAHLDASNRQKLVALVVDKLSSVFGLEQQFVVSHQADIINTVDAMVIVGQRGGSAVAEWR